MFGGVKKGTIIWKFDDIKQIIDDLLKNGVSKKEIIQELTNYINNKEVKKLPDLRHIIENYNSKFITIDELLRIAELAGDVVLDAKDELLELGVAYNDKIPMSRVNNILQNYDLEIDEFNEFENNKTTKLFTSINEFKKHI